MIHTLDRERERGERDRYLIYNLQLLNLIKYRSACFTGDPSTYINMKNDIRKGEKNQKNDI